MPCRCNTDKRDPDCTIEHTLSESLAATAFPNLDRDARALPGVYTALDALLKGVGLLPLNQITTRPVLHKAVDSATEVLDRAVKEGRYVAST